MRRAPRQRRQRGASAVGRRFTATVGPVAHGGHCVVRVPVGSSDERGETRVVFVRHALPGELVELEITEGSEGDRFWRGDTVGVLEASPDRVQPPCPFSGPGRCGGCDFQHVALDRQRELKADVVREQLVRLARLDPEHPVLAGLAVEAVPGDHDGLRWRTRMQYAVTPDGRPGLRKHRSREVVPVDDCLIAATPPQPPLVEEVALQSPLVEACTEEVVLRPSRSEVALQPSRNPSDRNHRRYRVDADGFWQVHPGAPRVLVETVLELLEPQPGEKALDLYAGVGLFAGFLGERVGERGSVLAVEGSRRASEHARANLADLRQVSVEAGSVDRVLDRLDCPPADLVVLDPPREGARRTVVEQIVSCAPRAVAYVACDPSALARDVATFAEHGYQLTELRAFDLFPMTHHVECVALLSRS